MGNKQSSNERAKGRPHSSVDVDAVKRRKNKGNRKPRPQSDPGVTGMDSNISFSPRHSDAADLTGRTQYHQHVRNPALRSEDEDGRESMDEARKRSRDRYWDSLTAILRIWMDMTPLKEIDVDAMDIPVIESLHSVFTRLYNYRDHTLTLRTKKKKVPTDVDDQRREIEDQMQEKGALNEDIGLLKGELIRRGIEPKLPERNRLTPSSPTSNRGDHSRGHSRNPSSADSEKLATEAAAASRNLGKRPSFMQPTPLLLAEGEKGYSDRVKRTPSLRPVGDHTQSHVRSRSMDANDDGHSELWPKRSTLSPDGAVSGGRVLEQLREKLVQMEKTLERERQENAMLAKRLELHETNVNLDSNKDRVRNVSQLTERFIRLETTAVSSLIRILENRLHTVPRENIHRFICATFTEAYQQSSDIMYRFYKALGVLMHNPVSSDLPHNAIVSYLPHSAGPSTSNTFSFDKERISRLAQRTPRFQELPLSLQTEIQKYMTQLADDTDMEDLVEKVVEHLRPSFRECMTTMVMNMAAYNNFIHDCCSVAWQMNLLQPKMHISTELPRSRTLDYSIHEAYMLGTGRVGNRIGYFVWPVLYEQRQGDMLHKGRVAVS